MVEELLQSTFSKYLCLLSKPAWLTWCHNRQRTFDLVRTKMIFIPGCLSHRNSLGEVLLYSAAYGLKTSYILLLSGYLESQIALLHEFSVFFFFFLILVIAEWQTFFAIKFMKKK